MSRFPVLGSACLVAGTTIGAGMLALPLTISGLGIIGGTFSMVLVWFVMYLAGLYGLELNLRAKQGMTLGGLGRYYSGPVAHFLGESSIIILTYALMTAYLFGGASILGNFARDYFPSLLQYLSPIFMMTIIVSLSLLGPIKIIDYSNRLFFIVMIFAMGILFLYPLLGITDIFFSVPLTGPKNFGIELTPWQKAFPVIFTSFGYHIIQNSMVVYCDYDAKALKKAFFWGSFIPLIVYILWLVLSVGVIYLREPAFYNTLLTQKIELGQFIKVFGQALGHPWLEHMSWVVALLAIITSAIGVGLAIIGLWEQYQPSLIKKRPFVLLFVLIPPLCIGNYIPQVFVGALGFAGLILTMIAIFLPLYLLRKSDQQHGVIVHYKITRNLLLQFLVFTLGLIVVFFEIRNIFSL